jgi:hypothetical protein
MNLEPLIELVARLVVHELGRSATTDTDTDHVASTTTIEDHENEAN